jgi:hypothetical protein
MLLVMRSGEKQLNDIYWSNFKLHFVIPVQAETLPPIQPRDKALCFLILLYCLR